MKLSREEFIAQVRYLGWICFQMGADLPLHDVDFDTYEISKERLEGLVQGTEWALKNKDATPEDNHINWMKSKIEQGYKYGETLSVENKTHPSLVDFKDLPIIEQKKDEMDLLMTKLANRLYEKIKEE